MLRTFLFLVCLLAQSYLHAQQSAPAPPNNVYQIRKHFFEKVLHNTTEHSEGDADNDLEQFNRWFNFVAPRCFPSGNLPRPDILITEYEKADLKAARKGTSGAVWQPLGPTAPPPGFNGVGRINCITIDPLDTNKLYAGAACGGVWKSNDGGASWATTSSNFPSLSVSDIVVNPHHTDTVYAATGDGFGYCAFNPGLNLLWGGLYSAGVMISGDAGLTWHTTGLSFLQSNQDIIQKLIIHPNHPEVLLAGCSNGIMRTTNGGVTWASVYPAHVFSMAFRPGRPDTVYATDTANLIVSYNAGATWSILYPGVVAYAGQRSTLGVSAASPKSIWILNDTGGLLISHNGGSSFALSAVAPRTSAFFYGYYDNVLTVSPDDSNVIYTAGIVIAKSADGGNSWASFGVTSFLHSDNHAVTINRFRSNTVYCGNDGGISVSRDGGDTWTVISDGLMISQIYRTSSSRQDPARIICGLQDNMDLYHNPTWQIGVFEVGDGTDNAIHPLNDSIQVASGQNGTFFISLDQGLTSTQLVIDGTVSGYWTSPVVMDPANPDIIYFGLTDIYATYDRGLTFTNLTHAAFDCAPQPGCSSLAISPSNTHVLYAADACSMRRTLDGGATWVDVTGSLPVSLAAISGIAVDFTNPMHVYVSLSGYSAINKVFVSTTGGATWTSMSTGLLNIPVNCIAADSSAAGAMFVGTDMGVYYTDNALGGTWVSYKTGLPNVIVDALDVNYTNHKIRAATYGRGLWECSIEHLPGTLAVNNIMPQVFNLAPNPATNKWNIILPQLSTPDYTIKVSDASGRLLQVVKNATQIDCGKFASGAYNIELIAGESHYTIKGIKK
jgi:photosystem II stability/assembly factor-like uncharacterized protein